MTPQEFKAWFEGFTDVMAAPPNVEQWEKIKARVKDIDGIAITYPIYVDRYQPQWILPRIPTYLPRLPNVWCSTSGVTSGSTEGQLMNSMQQGSFDSCMAMFALGKAEAIQ